MENGSCETWVYAGSSVKRSRWWHQLGICLLKNKGKLWSWMASAQLKLNLRFAVHNIHENIEWTERRVWARLFHTTWRPNDSRSSEALPCLQETSFGFLFIVWLVKMYISGTKEESQPQQNLWPANKNCYPCPKISMLPPNWSANVTNVSGCLFDSNFWSHTLS